MSARSTPKPWPMKYVAITIVVCLAAYTFLTLHFRKQGHVYQPYDDNKNRVLVHRLRAAGYQRITAEVERPAEQDAGLRLNGEAAVPSTVAGGLSPELKEIMIDQPHLPKTFSRVEAPRKANPLFPYSLEFTCTLQDNRELHASTYVYVKDREIAIVSDFEKMDGELLTRSPDTLVQVTLPAGTLARGDYDVTLVGEKESKRWTLQVH